MGNEDGPFREMIREFIGQCGKCEEYRIGGNLIWCTLFMSESGGVLFPLYTVEENVKNSSHPLCRHCRCAGWGHHFVSKRNYHLVIPKDDTWNKPLNEESLQLKNHLLHGVIHCNGFGHLLCVNGIEANSKYLYGQELMNLWDKLCTILQAREISVQDLSKKGCLDLRLLHGVAYGCPWFGKWGYKFGHVSSGVTQQRYDRAIEILRSLELTKIIHDLMNTRQGKLIEKIIQLYRDASSEAQLVTMSDLLQFMLAFKSTPLIQRKTTLALASILSKSSTKTIHEDKSSLQSHPSDHNSFTSHKVSNKSSFSAKFNNSRWPARRLEHVVEVIVDTLLAHGTKMGRQALRDAVQQHIGDTGLIDFVIKNIDNITMGNQRIHRAMNRVTKRFEFSLHSVADEGKTERKIEPPIVTSALEPGLNVYEDVLFLYKYVLLGYPECHQVSMASRSILDSKNFVKKWQFKGNNRDKLWRLICQVKPSYDELVNKFTQPLPPGELLVVPPCDTVDKLKLVVQCALRDTYYAMDNFVVREIGVDPFEGREEQDVLMFGVEQGVQIWVRGCGLDLDTKFRYQGGVNDGTMDCRCGVTDDDGESCLFPCRACSTARKKKY